jgi:hypothetical protein
LETASVIPVTGEHNPDGSICEQCGGIKNRIQPLFLTHVAGMKADEIVLTPTEPAPAGSDGFGGRAIMRPVVHHVNTPCRYARFFEVPTETTRDHGDPIDTACDVLLDSRGKARDSSATAIATLSGSGSEQVLHHEAYRRPPAASSDQGEHAIGKVRNDADDDIARGPEHSPTGGNQPRPFVEEPL